MAVVALPAIGSQVAPAVGPAAVGVGDTIGVCELAGAEDRARPAADVGGLGECRDAPGDIGGRLGDREAGRLDAGLAPAVLDDAEVLPQRLVPLGVAGAADDSEPAPPAARGVDRGADDCNGHYRGQRSAEIARRCEPT